MHLVTEAFWNVKKEIQQAYLIQNYPFAYNSSYSGLDFVYLECLLRRRFDVEGSLEQRQRRCHQTCWLCFFG
jgi:hypothetical protein